MGVGYMSSEEKVTNDQLEEWAIGAKYTIAKGLYTSVGFTFGDSTLGGASVDNAAGSPVSNDFWNGTLTVGMAF